MNFRSNISALNEDFIVEKLILSHDPDGRWLDSEMLLQEVETILSFVLQSDVTRRPSTENCITNIEVFESKETLPHTIFRISVQMLCPCMGENEIHTRTMVLFELLKEYRWDAKAVLVLGALAASYGGLLLPIHLAFSDPVAASIATLNQFPIERTKLGPWLNSLSLLFKAMVDVTKCITEFERLPVKQAKLDSNIVGETMSNISLATYQVVKSALICMQQIPYFKQPQQILWIPIPSSKKWTDEEKQNFNFFSNSLPWISVKWPWLMSSTVLNFLKTEWQYGDGETMVVVMDSNGRIVNVNAMDMALIWGLRAYPFSVSRENELWKEGRWSMQLLLDGIHPAFDTWVKEGRDICIIGSDNSDWVNEIKSLARKIQNQGFQFELIYVSKSTITSASAMEESSILFSPSIQQLFWLRLQSIKRSKLKRAESSKPDRVYEEVTKLLDFDYSTHKGWAVIGKASAAETEKIVGDNLTERIKRILRWGEYAMGLNFTEAIQIAEKKPCEESHTVVVPFEEGSTMRVVTCEKCKWPMKKFVAYQ